MIDLRQTVYNIIAGEWVFFRILLPLVHFCVVVRHQDIEHLVPDLGVLGGVGWKLEDVGVSPNEGVEGNKVEVGIVAVVKDCGGTGLGAGDVADKSPLNELAEYFDSHACQRE